MPLEISEIGVHLAVGPTVPGVAQKADAASAGCESNALTAAQQEEIVENCVRRVLQNLREREAR